ncbi:hypothetical protein LAZ40_17305 [Cereibacter sphaeroides]|uniref:tetratricopeptide repeat protein n=1 Tax=Rhodobacterales TaxID=204455 RepID=UPI000BBE9B91|nr:MULTISPECIES: tetratricopeptide repeat protein [Paracoccaceae]MCE6960786.1 hypothetical protein [Cereibacter sphaeroides]MCE6969948.1 hypothetical protein [Cereibacter sphaeroides]MCE6974336.1 hypothetical protein [Cereibacter sphaeroides]
MDDDAAVPPDMVLAELDRILRSPSFQTTDRNRRFLRYVVEETLAGRGERIKAYSIGTSVFGRGDGFDPQQDPIVRIEAGRLRRSLQYHYLTHGTETGLRITIPKGSYMPSFELDQPSRPGTQPPDLHSRAPHVMVRSFEQQCWSADWPDLARTLTLQVISALTRFTELFVYGFGTSTALSEADREARVEIDYELTGNLTITQSAIRAEFLLQNAHEGRYIWSHSIERVIGPSLDPAELVSVCAGIAGEVASLIAQRDGIMDSQAREMAGRMPAQFAAYQKLVDFQDYWRTVDFTRFEPLRQDLERVIAEDPQFATGHACLALLYSDAARYGLDCGPDHPRPIERALALAKRAVQLAPRSGRAHHALGVAEWFSGYPEKAIETLKVACALNPNDSELNAELGFRSAARMDWDVAVPLLTASFQRNPLQSEQYRMGLFLYHFAQGNYEQALTEARSINAPSVAQTHIACAVSLIPLGRHDEAMACLEEAERISPGLLGRLREDLAFRQIHPDLISMIVDTIGPLRGRTAAIAQSGVR